MAADGMLDSKPLAGNLSNGNQHASLRIKELRPTLTLKLERCLTCHDGIEEISPSHPLDAFGCVVCHGGNGLGLTVESAHQNLLGGSNPSDFSVIDKTCGQSGGKCHSGRVHPFQNVVDRAKTGLMSTMAGVIASLRFSWGAQITSDALYSSTRTEGYPSSSSTRPVLSTIPLMNPPPYSVPDDLEQAPTEVSGHPADDQWRKFCSRCHLRNRRESGPSAHSSGCAACHALYNSTATYEGSDPTLSKSRPGYAAKHRLSTAVPVDQCLRCHNRSGRIGLTFTGLMESDGYGTPYHGGKPNLGQLHGDRDIRHLTPDIHFERGMACIDCHTEKDLMGDDQIHNHARDQVEIRCTDCHGSYGKSPLKRQVTPENVQIGWLSRTFNDLGLMSRDIVITESGSPLRNLHFLGERLILRGKMDGKDHPCPVITGDSIHCIPGHDSSRMECTACHSTWAPQCYGCHDYRKEGKTMKDTMLGIDSDGRWYETRDYYRHEKPTLGINSRGRVSIMVPGCQVIYSEIRSDGSPITGKEKRVFSSETLPHGIVWTPITPHSTRTEVRQCIECHADPKTLGFGEGFFNAGEDWQGNSFTPVLNPDVNPQGFAWESMMDATGIPLATTTHSGARPFEKEELTRILRVAPCIPCHDKYDDPIWKNPKDSMERAKSHDHQNKVTRFLRGEQ